MAGRGRLRTAEPVVVAVEAVRGDVDETTITSRVHLLLHTAVARLLIEIATQEVRCCFGVCCCCRCFFISSLAPLLSLVILDQASARPSIPDLCPQLTHVIPCST